MCSRKTNVFFRISGRVASLCCHREDCRLAVERVYNAISLPGQACMQDRMCFRSQPLLDQVPTICSKAMSSLHWYDNASRNQAHLKACSPGLRYSSPLIAEKTNGLSLAVMREKAFISPWLGNVSRNDCRKSVSPSILAVWISRLESVRARLKIFLTSGRNIVKLSASSRQTH